MGKTQAGQDTEEHAPGWFRHQAVTLARAVLDHRHHRSTLCRFCSLGVTKPQRDVDIPAEEHDGACPVLVALDVLGAI